MTKESEILEPVEFAIIKEYIEVGGSDEGIAKVSGLSRKVVGNIRNAPHYKQYMEDLKQIHRSKIIPEEEVSEDILKVLTNLTTAVNTMSASFDRLEPKLNEVLEARKPWLGRTGDGFKWRV